MWRQSRSASAADLAPPRPPPRNRSYSSGTDKTFCWYRESWIGCFFMLDRRGELLGGERAGRRGGATRAARPARAASRRRPTINRARLGHFFLPPTARSTTAGSAVRLGPGFDGGTPSAPLPSWIFFWRASTCLRFSAVLSSGI